MNDASSREPSPQESLKAFESDLRRKLGAANAPPFIGLLDVGPEYRERIRHLVREKIAGDFRRVSWTFNATPAVAAWSVAGALTEDYGGQDAAIYRIVEDVLGVSLQLPVRRDKLYVAFSDVCRRFELALFRGGRKVDAYLVQAGVSRPQLPDVIEAFLRAERAFGPPPTHATDALNSWEDEAFEFLPQGLRVPRRVLEADDTGFHAAAFARCRSGAIPQTDFERRFQSVLEEIRSRAPSARRRQKTVARPKLVWSDGALALSVPLLEGRLRIDFNDQKLRLREGIDWPIPQPWPRRRLREGALSRLGQEQGTAQPVIRLGQSAHCRALCRSLSGATQEQCVHSGGKPLKREHNHCQEAKISTISMQISLPTPPQTPPSANITLHPPLLRSCSDLP